MNNTQLIGRMTKDVDMKYTQNGVAVATFTLAVNRPFTNKNGDREADFIRCQVWRKLAENTAQFCKKGSRVGVTGRIQTRSFEGQDGKPVFMTEIVGDQVEFLDSKTSQGKGSPSNQSSGQPNPFQGQPVEVDDKDLPF
ncbi:single-stranded DNA-binding protein [Lentibacillus cibarius]|uniref:Single-stranded DNA-binding protein n=1 Tax=Lentibacillus cibarius TaxID=2583219 RepID=A0A5S3QG47_9BACI|nr:single-stranded DNA-binding protein [Lentibacillus cibarius]TMN20904.1 single-stranded DNA-binding protein [Lentibacillus cibarius]